MNYLHHSHFPLVSTSFLSDFADLELLFQRFSRALDEVVVVKFCLILEVVVYLESFDEFPRFYFLLLQ